MAEPTLSVTLSGLQIEVCRFLGYGRDYGAITSDQQSDVSYSIRAGYRRFLNPPIVSGMNRNHQWSFLSKSGTITTVVGTETYTLPDDFGGLDSPELMFSPGINSCYPSVAIIGEHQVTQLYHRSNISGIPQYAAIRSTPTTTDTTGERFSVTLYPKPSAILVLNYRYNILANELTALLPFPLGGMQHANTVIAACLAAADLRFNDQIGVHEEAFMRELAASVEFDKRFTVPQTLGTEGCEPILDDYYEQSRDINLTINY